MTENLSNIIVNNDYQTIDDLPFTPKQKMMVLAWFAQMSLIWRTAAVIINTIL